MGNLERFADTLAGRRGLRRSDSPVARPAMEAARDLQLGIGSERARIGMESTLQFAASQQSFDEVFRQSLAGFRTGAWQTRMNAMFGGGMSGASNIGITTTTTMRPSTAQQISQGMSLGSQVIRLGGQIGAMGMGMPGMGGGGGGVMQSASGGYVNLPR